MRIVRYPLEMVEYQQIQPLWPGRILSVAPGRVDHLEPSHRAGQQRIDMWAIDNDAARGDRQPPILGVWLIGTGWDMPTEARFAEAMFHGTCVMRNGEVYHVFSAVVGIAEDPRTAPPAYASVDDMAERIRAEHAAKRGQR